MDGSPLSFTLPGDAIREGFVHRTDRWATELSAYGDAAPALTDALAEWGLDAQQFHHGVRCSLACDAGGQNLRVFLRIATRLERAGFTRH